MASVHVVLCTVQGRALTGASLPVASSRPLGSETIELTGASVVSSLVATAADQVWVVTAVGGSAWLAFDESPEAVVGEGWLLSAGPQLYLTAAAPGEKIAALAAA